MSQFPKPALGKKSLSINSFNSRLKTYVGCLQKFLKKSDFTTRQERTRCDLNLSRKTRNTIGKALVSVMHNKNRLNNIVITAKPQHSNPILQPMILPVKRAAYFIISILLGAIYEISKILDT